ATAIVVVVEEPQCLAIDRVDQRAVHAGGALLDLIERGMTPAVGLPPFAHLELIAAQPAVIVSGIKDRFEDVALFTYIVVHAGAPCWCHAERDCGCRGARLPHRQSRRHDAWDCDARKTPTNRANRGCSRFARDRGRRSGTRSRARLG